MSKFSSIILIFCIFAINLVLARNPGLKSTITTNGINYAARVGIDILRRELARINIPPLETRVGTPIGTIDLTISELKINHLRLDHYNIRLNSAANEGTVDITQAEINISFRWRYRRRSWPNLSDSGSGTVTTTGNRISADISPFVTNGKPQVTVKNVQFSIGNFGIRLSGGASWLYNILLPLFRNNVRREIEKAVRDNAGRIINTELNAVLMKLPTTVRIPSSILDLGIDWSILGVAIQNNHLSLNHLGQFYTYTNRKPTNIPSAPTPSITQGDKMLEIIVNEFFGLTAGEALHDQGFFKVTVTDSLLPPDAPIRLQTNAFRFIVPNLHRLHPDKNIILKIKSLEKPTGKITKADAINVVGVTQIEWHVEKDGHEELAFVLKTTVTCSGRASVEDNKLKGELSLLNLMSEVTSSNIGEININTFNNLINVLFVRGLIPIVNNLLQTGVNLPSIPDLHLLDPTVVYNDGFVSIALNVRYDVYVTNQMIDNIVELYD